MNIQSENTHSTDQPQVGRYSFANDRLFLSCGLAAGLLFWAALDDHSDGFYTFLRIYVCGLSLICGFSFRSVNRPALALAAICCAILFNPIFEIEFAQNDWKIIDVCVSVVFVWLALQQYALFKGKRLLPYAGGLVIGAIGLFSIADITRQFASSAPENTMNVDETLTVENMTANDPADLQLPLPAWQLAPSVLNDVDESASDTSDSGQGYLPRSQSNKELNRYTLNTRPDGTTAPSPSPPVDSLGEAPAGSKDANESTEIASNNAMEE